MSCDKWRWTEECEGRPCPGDCDLCNYDPRRPHPWLYKHDHNVRLICDNCVRFEECGVSGWICGDFRLNENYQVAMELK